MAAQMTANFGTRGGRSSDSTLPFFNVLSTANAKGFVLAVGWSGSWNTSFTNTGRGMSVKACFGAPLSLVLNPGELIRVLSVVLLPFNGSGHNYGVLVWRRFMRDHVSPNVLGPLGSTIPQSASAASMPGNNWTSSNQIEGLSNAAKLLGTAGVDTWWIDAGYNTGGFPYGQGNWGADPARFDNASLASISAAAKRNRLRLLVWFEPERVMPGTELSSKQHWLSPPPVDLPHCPKDESNWRLLDLGNVDVLQYAKDTLTNYLQDWGVDVYRQDCNIEPACFWLAHDKVNGKYRTGLAEIRHIEGLYSLWDHLQRNIPGLLIDNCASGGRRLDVELLSRSVTLWRSDDCWKDVDTQAMTYGLSHWLPYHGLGSISPNTVPFRSGLGETQSWVAPWYSPPPDTPGGYWDQWRKDILLVTSAAPGHPYPVRLLFSQDFYALSSYSVEDGTWLALQFHDPLHGVGVVLVYRRIQTTTSRFQTMPLGGLETNRSYCFTSWDSDSQGGAVIAPTIVVGLDLMTHGASVWVPTAPGAGVFTYAAC